MGIKNIAKFGKMIAQFLANFAPCFVRIQGRSLLSTYVQGLLSDVQRKNVEAILSQLFCAKVRQKLSPSEDVLTGELLTLEQVRRQSRFPAARLLRRLRRSERPSFAVRLP